MQKQLNEDLRIKLNDFCKTQNLIRRFSGEELEHYGNILKQPEIKSVIEDEELMHTVHAFFENNLNISATSKSSFMHRNTLIYRLEKIKRVTGFNIKKFEDAILFNYILKIIKLVELDKKQKAD